MSSHRPEPIVKALTLKMGFEKPSQIQAAALPIVLKHNNLIAQAQTGSGKTVAFVIAMLNRIDVTSPTLQAVCLSPTRELAAQIVNRAVIPLSSYMEGIQVETALGGTRFQGRSKHHIVVGTPGKVLDMFKKRYLNGATVKIMVCDEADVMVAQESRAKGLGADTLAIKSFIPATSQTLFFSATYTSDVLEFSKKIVKRAYVIKLSTSNEQVLNTIMQVWMDTAKITGGGGKLKALQDIYEYLAIQQSIVFVDTRRNCDDVARKMNEMGFTVSTLHGEKTNEERDDVMEKFRSGHSKVLVTTDVLQRGVDVPAIAVVVNYDLPKKRTGGGDKTAYLHRIGRTSRFGRSGTAINFVDNAEDRRLLKDIQDEFPDKPHLIREWDVNDVEGFAEHRENYRGEDADAEGDSKVAG
jgi:ATP-dependent RNA helicase DDX19/DBP5